MTDSLFLKYRPTQFTDLVGQSLSAQVLRRMIELDRVPSGLLFSGPSGSGKTSAARILASSLSSSTVEIDAASNRGVDHVRSLIDSLRYSSGASTIILDEAHNLTREAFNALLKTLEEPPAGTVFLLLTTEPQKIPATVTSRLMEFEFRRISPADILNRLMYVSSEEKIDLPTDLLKLIADESDGNLRSALTSLEFLNMSGIESIEDYRKLLGRTDYAVELVNLMCQGSEADTFSALDAALAVAPSPHEVTSHVLAVFRDLLILRAGGTPLVEGHGLALRRDLSVTIDRDRLLSCIKLVWDLRTRVRVSDDPRGALEVAIILMSDVLSAGRPIPTPQAVVDSKPIVEAQASTPSGKLSLSEMRSS